MLSGEGKENGEKTTIGLISKKSNFARPAHFFVHFFAVVLHDYNVKLPETFLWRKCRTCSRSLFFFTAAHFLLALVAASISHFVTAATKFSCCFSNKKCLLCFFFFFISRSRSLSLFFSLSFAGLPSTFSFSLSFFALCSKFVGMTINLSLTLSTTRIQKQFPLSVFVFIDSLVVTRVAMRFPAKITSSCICVAIPVD